MVYAGDDGHAYDLIRSGACGVVSVASHLVGKTIKSALACMTKEDVQGARSTFDRLSEIIDALFITTNPAPLKAALNMVGFAYRPSHMFF